jgi:hypothetical protein
MRGYLVLRVSKERNGRDTADLFTGPAQLGEPTFLEVQKLARKHGYDVAPIIGRYRTEPVRKEWPWTITAYTSREKSGMGRCGSSLQGWLAQPILCTYCGGTGIVKGTPVLHYGTPVHMCRAKGCRGTGRIHQGRG